MMRRSTRLVLLLLVATSLATTAARAESPQRTLTMRRLATLGAYINDLRHRCGGYPVADALSLYAKPPWSDIALAYSCDVDAGGPGPIDLPDAWGHAFRYRAVGQPHKEHVSILAAGLAWDLEVDVAPRFELRSAGPDGAHGTGDDIVIDENNVEATIESHEMVPPHRTWAEDEMNRLLSIATAIGSYRVDYGADALPSSLAELEGGYAIGVTTGRPLRYERIGKSYRITDAWRDGKLGTADDVVIEEDKIVRFPDDDVSRLLHAERRRAVHVIQHLQSVFPGPINTVRFHGSPSDRLAILEAISLSCALPPPDEVGPFLTSLDPALRRRAAALVAGNLVACAARDTDPVRSAGVARSFRAQAEALVAIAKHDGPEAARDAALALAVVAPDVVLERLGDITDRRLVAEVVRLTRNPGYLHRVEDLVQDRDWRVRIAAYRALWAIDAHQAAMGALDDPDPAVRADFIQRFERPSASVEPAVAEAILPVARELASRPGAARFVGLQWLASHDTPDVDLLIDVADSEDRQVIGSAVVQLRKVKSDPRVQAVARRWLNSSQPSLRGFALEVLPSGVLGQDEEAARHALAGSGEVNGRARALAAAVRDGSIGRAAADRILASASPRDRSVLYGALLDSPLATDPTFVVAAADANALNVVALMAKSPDPAYVAPLLRIGRARPMEDRGEILTALGNTWDARAEELVLQSFRSDVAAVLAGKQPRINGPALAAMAQVGGERTIAALQATLDRFLDPALDPVNADAIVMTMRAMASPACQRHLTEVLPRVIGRDSSWDVVKNEIVTTLKLGGIPDPAPLVRFLRTTTDRSWRPTFIDLLGACPAPEATAALVEEIHRSTDEKEQHILAQLLHQRGAQDALAGYAQHAYPKPCFECLRYLARPPHPLLPKIAASSSWWKNDDDVIQGLAELGDADSVRLLLSALDDAPYQAPFDYPQCPAIDPRFVAPKGMVAHDAWPSIRRALARCYSRWKGEQAHVLATTSPGGLLQLAISVRHIGDIDDRAALARPLLEGSCRLAQLATLQSLDEAGVPAELYSSVERIALTSSAPRIRRLAGHLAGTPEQSPPAPSPLPPDAARPLDLSMAALKELYDDPALDIVSLVRIVRFGRPTRTIVERLGNTLDPRAVPALLELLATQVESKAWSDIPTRCRALALIDDGAAAGAMAALAISSARTPAEAYAVTWIAEALTAIDDPRSEHALVAIYQALPPGQPRDAIFWALGQKQSGLIAGDVYRRALEELQGGTGIQATTWLAGMSDPEALAFLKEQAAKGRTEQRTVLPALLAAGKLDLFEQLAPSLAPDPDWADWNLFQHHPTPALIPLIEPALARWDNDSTVPAPAFITIAKIRDPRSVAACVKLIADAPYSERSLGSLPNPAAPSVAPHEKVHAALAELHPISRAAIEQLARSGKPGERLQAALVLRQLRAGEGVDLIRLLLADHYPYVRFAALCAVKEGDLPALRHEIDVIRSRDVAPRLRRAASSVLAAGPKARRIS